MIVHRNDIAVEQLNEKITRRILNHSPSLMIAEMHFKEGGVGEPHSHTDHEQMGYVIKGSFSVLLGEETKKLKVGDSFYAAKNVRHGVTALEDSALLDIFTPRRNDYLQVIP